MKAANLIRTTVDIRQTRHVRALKTDAAVSCVLPMTGATRLRTAD